MPCPSCGFTTTFTLAAHLQFVNAIKCQPFGFALFVLTIVLAPLSIGSGVRAVSLMALTERWRWRRILSVVALLWLLAWAYKWKALVP